MVFPRIGSDRIRGLLAHSVDAGLAPQGKDHRGDFSAHNGKSSPPWVRVFAESVRSTDSTDTRGSPHVRIVQWGSFARSTVDRPTHHLTCGAGGTQPTDNRPDNTLISSGRDEVRLRPATGTPCCCRRGAVRQRIAGCRSGSGRPWPEGHARAASCTDLTLVPPELQHVRRPR